MKIKLTSAQPQARSALIYPNLSSERLFVAFSLLSSAIVKAVRESMPDSAHNQATVVEGMIQEELDKLPVTELEWPGLRFWYGALAGASLTLVLLYYLT